MVTIVNRNTKTKLKGKFDLYYGLAVGESGRHFEYYFRMTKNAPIKIALSTGASQHITVKNYHDRVTSFEKRNNFIINESTLTLRNISFNKLTNDVDAIFYHGHDFTLSSYSQVNTKKYQIPSPIKDGIIPTLKEIQNDKLRTKNFSFIQAQDSFIKVLI